MNKQISWPLYSGAFAGSWFGWAVQNPYAIIPIIIFLVFLELVLIGDDKKEARKT